MRKRKNDGSSKREIVKTKMRNSQNKNAIPSKLRFTSSETKAGRGSA